MAKKKAGKAKKVSKRKARDEELDDDEPDEAPKKGKGRKRDQSVTFGAADLAKVLKTEPKRLRMFLREKADDLGMSHEERARYDFKSEDSKITKKIIRAFPDWEEEKAESRARSAENLKKARKARGKKATKKVTKKTKKSSKRKSDEDDEEEEEGDEEESDEEDEEGEDDEL